jgi:hypothetical protein
MGVISLGSLRKCVHCQKADQLGFLPAGHTVNGWFHKMFWVYLLTERNLLQGIRGGGRGRGKVAQVRPVKSVDNMGERNPMSSSGEPNQYVITQSTHVCGYPDCMKKFSRKDTLVRHQVKVHGRDPVKRGTPKKHCFGAGMEADYGNEGVDDSYGYEVYQ